MKFKRIMLSVIAICLLLIATGCGQKEFTVIFDSSGGSIVENQTVKENGYVTKPSNPTKEGYNFLYWELDNDEYDFESEVTKDITLVAKYEELSDTAYSITFNSKGGSAVDSQSIEIGLKATKPEDPTKDGYKFLYWTLDNTEYNFDNVVTKNITLEAKWEEKYTITFNSDGGSKVLSQSIENGAKVTKPTNPTKSGYAFKGWYLNDTEYDFKSAVTKDLTLVAKWEVAVPKYTVTFNSNGGSSVASQSIETGLKATKPTNPTRSGYTFEGWFIGATEFNFNTAITKNTTLTAKWESVVVPDVYTISQQTYQDLSPQVIIVVKKNGIKITASAVLNSSETILGTYNSEVGEILVAKLEYDRITKVKLTNGTIVNIE